MNLPSLSLIVGLLALLLSPMPLASQEADASSALGDLIGANAGACGLLGYTSHVAMGRIYRSDLSSLEKLRSAAQDTGGIIGGLKVLIKKQKALLDDLPEHEVPALEKVIVVLESLVEQGDALVAYLLATNTGEGVKQAKLEFEAKRAISRPLISKLLGLEETPEILE